jgi:formylglycine-generating enzyme required for sulfatase activity
MKHFLLAFLIALAATVSSSAQTLQVDPIYIGGTATFEVQNGTPNKTAVICYSLNGSGPFTSSHGITLDLSLPINRLNPLALDALGNGTLGPFPLPASAVVGMQVWFQGVQIDALSNPVYTVTNMVPITVDAPPPPVDMVAIPGGTFEMGDHAGVGFTNERPIHSVTLDAFLMDKYEVSNTKFADFLNNSIVTVVGVSVYQVGGAGQRICFLSNGLTHNGSTFVIDAGKDHHPVVNVTWHGAALYSNYLSTLNGRTPCYDETTFACDFTADGFRLPTEAEWEYASRGGEHTPYYQYQWASDSITSSDANYDYNIGTTVDLGSYAANGYGLYDMAGNVWEWCNDWYDSSYYSNSPSTNPTGPASGSYRVVRGGSWRSSATDLRCAYRAYNFPTYGTTYIGFRVVTVQ